MNETAFSNLVRRRLPGWHFKAHGGLMQQPGIPDVLGCFAGLFYGVEFKIEPNKLTQLQEFTLKEISRNGGLALTITKKGESVCIYTFRMLDRTIKYTLVDQFTMQQLSSGRLGETFISCVSFLQEQTSAPFLFQIKSDFEKQIKTIEEI